MRKPSCTKSALLGVLVLGPCLSGAGCSFFLPRHPNSLDAKKERVQVRLLASDDVASDATFCDAYRNAFSGLGNRSACCSEAPVQALATIASFVVTDASGRVVFESPDLDRSQDIFDRLTTTATAQFLPALAAPAAGLAAEFAVDYVRKQLEEEATKYTAQFDALAYFDDFWVMETADLLLESAKGHGLYRRETSYKQRYCGIEVARTTSDHGPDDPAFRLRLGMAPSKDQQFLVTAPLSVVTRAAKAKVLDDRWWTQVLLYGFALDADDEVSTHVDVELAAVRRTQAPGPSDAVYRAEKLLALSFDLPRQNLDQPKELTVSGASANDTLPTRVGGWFGAVPRSFDERGVPVGEGTGTVRVLVTERDPSNAKKAVEQAATQLSNAKEKIVEKVKEGVTGTLPH